MIHISLSSKRRGQADPTQEGGCRPGGGSHGAKLIAGFSDSVMERCGGFTIILFLSHIFLLRCLLGGIPNDI